MTRRKRFESGQFVIPSDMLGKLTEGAPPGELIAPMVRPFFQGIENEFAHINTEAEFLKWLIDTYGSKTRAELTNVENWMFDACRARSTVIIFSGIERILIRICIEIDEHHPEDSMAAKRDALERLSIEMPVPAPLGHRAAVISKDTRDVLNELMRFRRAERGCYTFQLKELDLVGSAEKALAIIDVVKADVDRFKINLARQEYS